MAEFVVGTALAVLPLALKGIALYAEVATNFRVLINYPSEIQELSVTLRANDFLVRFAATRLIGSICGGDLKMADELLAVPEQALLIGLNVSSMPMGLLEGMGEVFDLWTETLQTVHLKLDTIKQRLDKMYPSTAQQTSQPPDKFRLFRKRQASPVEPMKPQPRSLAIYHRIQATSSTLYRIIAMRCSCARRDQHLLSISLLDRPILADDSPKTIFSIAISACHDPSFKQRILLEAESVDFQAEDRRRPFGLIDRLHDPTGRRGGAVMSALYASHHEASARYGRPWAAPEPLVAARFDSSCPQAGQSMEITDDICRHFQDALTNSGQTWKRYIRGPEDNSGFEMRPHRKGTLGTQCSLAEIITSMSQTGDTRQPGLPRASLARLAGALAHIILQYHSTPWLSGTWKSSDVTFIESREDPHTTEGHGHGSGGLLSQPYLMTTFPSFPRPGVPAVGLPTSLMREATDSSLSSGTARSEIMFHFGVILLELGFGQPWSILRQSVLADNVLRGMDRQNVSNGKVAEELAQNKRLQDRMGMNYCRIVRRWLSCDFGLGEDKFENVDLQGAFLVDVVTALEQTEGMLKGLDIWNFQH
ncbi:hypothetical protein B0T14DRAFT_568143 [Immersiella caudata]|uniref:DUF7580 domain-containing protein n=1 Tax=Immersiella caudata TaxID=314043 RepID=A0AA40BWU7_9PEZI|nr:hypothetical protein B0T14DRAFT_568143 [Immersiella caudata]